MYKILNSDIQKKVELLIWLFDLCWKMRFSIFSLRTFAIWTKVIAKIFFIIPEPMRPCSTLHLRQFSFGRFLKNLFCVSRISKIFKKFSVFHPRSRPGPKMVQLPQTSSKKKWKTSFLNKDQKVELVIRLFSD